MATNEIKIDPQLFTELTSTLSSESSEVEGMIAALDHLKQSMMDQGINSSSLSILVNYCDTLINMMNITSDSLVLLNDNAKTMSKAYVDTDEHAAQLHRTYGSETRY
ncbi:hypothetical protein [Mesobacillus zeae]|uniref:ESX-1 secretion-associated protein n=1 Tax=Mesobacillus zeae TaxID=1917180 RepID=A0A398BAJ9_9BACI|nr:hypothetical protein [Mesobacillus zeae]RID85878.1 hypothetical protein D1970_10165 [Mesobacillus zeae]